MRTGPRAVLLPLLLAVSAWAGLLEAASTAKTPPPAAKAPPPAAKPPTPPAAKAPPPAANLATRTGDEETANEEICECVPYFQCDEDRRIKTDGSDLLDPRMPTCADLDVCCFPPKEEVEGGGGKEPLPSEPIQNPEPPIDPPRPPVDPPSPPVDSGTDRPCECVPFFQCDEDRQFKDDGSGNLDPRFACPGEIEICCFPPREEGGEDGFKLPVSPPVGPPVSPPVGPPIGPPDGPPDGSPDGPPDGPSEPDYTHVPKPQPPRISGCGHQRVTEDVDFGNSFRITGPEGSPVPTGFGEFPWMIGLFRNDELICGGSLIAPSVVLTAAHCLNKAEGGKLTLRAGDWDIYQTKEPISHQERCPGTVIHHPAYNPNNLHNDIALIILEQPFEITDTVDTICFSPPKTTYNHNCIATGWGKTGYGPEAELPSILKQVSLPLVDKAQCQERLRKTRLGKYFKLHKSFVCAGGIPDHDTCTGDGGGPLVCPLSDGSYTQVGIVAWGIGCGNENPAVYVSVHHFADWIHEQLKKL